MTATHRMEVAASMTRPRWCEERAFPLEVSLHRSLTGIVQEMMVLCRRATPINPTKALPKSQAAAGSGTTLIGPRLDSRNPRLLPPIRGLYSLV